MKLDLIIHDIRDLVLFEDESRPMPVVKSLQNAALAIHEGMIVAIGKTADIRRDFEAEMLIDASGLMVLPGFVDSHSHPVFVHTREREFTMRLEGKTYVEISQEGGGIISTLSSTRDADPELLYQLAMQRLDRMIRQGTTTLEAKSGYGLSTQSELKQLEVIGRLAEDSPLDIVPTFMGAHEYPPEYKQNHEAYLNILTREMIPAVAKQGIARFCDIFTEAHVYSIEESRRVLETARKYGMKLKMHADEIEAIGGAELAAELGCISADHLGAASDAGIEALGEKGVVACLLPATLFSLRSKNYARARYMIDRGLTVAIATDYNPGSCNCDSMPITMSLACLQMGMLPSEALVASTINAAKSIGLQDRLGSIKIGKQADLVLWDIPSIDYIPYHLGSLQIKSVIKKGKIIFGQD